MITIDARGLFCPAPVVEARKALAKLPKEGGHIQILVDNRMAAENLERMAKSMGHASTLADQGGDNYSVTITIGESVPPPPPEPAEIPHLQSGEGLVVAIGRNRMGEGEDDLGEILVKGFLYTLSELPVPPRALLLFNSGIRLALAGANTLTDFQTLTKRGTRLLVCGTCLNYYEAADQLAVGEIANMYDLVREMTEAAKLINL